MVSSCDDTIQPEKLSSQFRNVLVRGKQDLGKSMLKSGNMDQTVRLPKDTWNSSLTVCAAKNFGGELMQGSGSHMNPRREFGPEISLPMSSGPVVRSMNFCHTPHNDRVPWWNGAQQLPGNGREDQGIFSGYVNGDSFMTNAYGAGHDPEIIWSSEPKSDECDDDIFVVDVVEPSKKARMEGSVTSEHLQHQPCCSESSIQDPDSAMMDNIVNTVIAESQPSANRDRKVVDALMGVIGDQIRKERAIIHKLLLDKKLIVPNSVSIPPSQVVSLVIEHDADKVLSELITRMFGKHKADLTASEKREISAVEQQYPAPHMTKVLMDIGHDLVQEAAFSDIVYSKNLLELSTDRAAYRQVAEQLKLNLQMLHKKNEPFRLRQLKCHVCSFITESAIVMDIHSRSLHFDGSKYQCYFCPEFFTNENMIKQHYLCAHCLIVKKEDTDLRYHCTSCDADFVLKAQADRHIRQCKIETRRYRKVQRPQLPEDISAVNTWLWEKPAPDPGFRRLQHFSHNQAAEEQRIHAFAKDLRRLRSEMQLVMSFPPRQDQPLSQQLEGPEVSRPAARTIPLQLSEIRVEFGGGEAASRGNAYRDVTVEQAVSEIVKIPSLNRGLNMRRGAARSVRPLTVQRESSAQEATPDVVVCGVVKPRSVKRNPIVNQGVSAIVRTPSAPPEPTVMQVATATVKRPVMEHQTTVKKIAATSVRPLNVQQGSFLNRGVTGTVSSDILEPLPAFKQAIPGTVRLLSAQRQSTVEKAIPAVQQDSTVNRAFTGIVNSSSLQKQFPAKRSISGTVPPAITDLQPTVERAVTTSTIPPVVQQGSSVNRAATGVVNSAVFQNQFLVKRTAPGILRSTAKQHQPTVEKAVTASARPPVVQQGSTLNGAATGVVNSAIVQNQFLVKRTVPESTRSTAKQRQPTVKKAVTASVKPPIVQQDFTMKKTVSGSIRSPFSQQESVNHGDRETVKPLFAVREPIVKQTVAETVLSLVSQAAQVGQLTAQNRASGAAVPSSRKRKANQLTTGTAKSFEAQQSQPYRQANGAFTQNEAIGKDVFQLPTSSTAKANAPRSKTSQGVTPLASGSRSESPTAVKFISCELCDGEITWSRYITHLQISHEQLQGASSNIVKDPTLACSRCNEKFRTYDGLNRHFLIAHSVVTSDLLEKHNNKKDGGYCRLCKGSYFVSLVKHVALNHQKELFSGEVLYNCEVCDFRCQRSSELEGHFLICHSKNRASSSSAGVAQRKKPRQNGKRKLSAGGVPTATGESRAQRRGRKYGCSACREVFYSNVDVIEHWQQKHLKSMRVSLCRIDQCRTHLQELRNENVRVDLTFPERQSNVGSDIVVIED